MNNKLFSSLIIIPILVASVYGYYANVAAMKGEGAVSSLRDALTYVESNWQPGDIIYVTDDGPWINLVPYAKTHIYRMPECQDPVRGSLSTETRAALGVDVLRLQDIPHTRAWIFAPFSPLHPDCYEQQVNALIGKRLPVYEVDKNDWLYSAVWLVDAK